MNKCKFCGVTDDIKHINRDSLCARCYRILEKVRQGRSTQEEKEWHDEMCRFNIKHGMFVPIAMRRKLAHLKPAPVWACKKCGKKVITDRDANYINYCVACADEIRRNRKMPAKAERKTRSDKGGKHASPYSSGIMTKPDRRVKNKDK